MLTRHGAICGAGRRSVVSCENDQGAVRMSAGVLWGGVRMLLRRVDKKQGAQQAVNTKRGEEAHSSPHEAREQPGRTLGYALRCTPVQGQCAPVHVYR